MLGCGESRLEGGVHKRSRVEPGWRQLAHGIGRDAPQPTSYLTAASANSHGACAAQLLSSNECVNPGRLWTDVGGCAGLVLAPVSLRWQCYVLAKEAESGASGAVESARMLEDQTLRHCHCHTTAAAE